MLKLPANEDEMRAWAWLATRRPRKYRGGGIDEVKATSGPRTLIRTTRVAFEVRAGNLVLLLVVLGCRAPAFGQNAKELSTQISPPNLAPTLPLDPARRTELQQALKTRNYTGAETLLVKEIERIPTSAQLPMCLGRVLFLDGKYLNSAVAMKKAEALDPLDDQDRFTLAMAYLALEHADWARPELEKLARSDPRNAL